MTRNSEVKLCEVSQPRPQVEVEVRPDRDGSAPQALLYFQSS